MTDIKEIRAVAEKELSAAQQIEQLTYANKELENERDALRARIYGSLIGSVFETRVNKYGMSTVVVHCSSANLRKAGPIIFRTVRLIVEQEEVQP